MEFNSNFAFIIDTEQYAGNFEREMCAYCTGQIGDCGVGDEFALLFNKEENISDDYFDNIAQESDEHGCARPCKIYPTEGWFNHGMGGHFREGQEKEALKHYIAAVEKYETPLLKQAEKNKVKLAGEKIQNWTIEGCGREIKGHSKRIKKANKLIKVRKYPAALSVAILFYKKPTKEQIDLIKRRAFKFNEARQKYYTEKYDESFAKSFGQIKITGFRLIEQKRNLIEELI
jgi:hypothetical protein